MDTPKLLPHCEIDPAIQLWNYYPMWEGSRGIKSWTSGYNGNNALYLDYVGFELDSGSATANVNAFHIKVNNSASQMKEKNYGFKVYKNKGKCLAKLPKESMGGETQFKLYVRPWGA